MTVPFNNMTTVSGDASFITQMTPFYLTAD